MTEKKGIAVLGSTGSIGAYALEVIECNPDFFDLQVISANSNSDLLIEFLITYFFCLFVLYMSFQVYQIGFKS